ncbi:hypothetical protein BAE44_0020152 [Dichanthelium oligosanthes]|uniref:Uncharacterized protein n=1 Tax=Dichanthelium oligosanthes TaxID=888268 RepID=A0A1E5V135_9POAL|nr:hypothetical protein BAE44_0020152 [Dichanthelium oligosanthes]
MGVSAQADSCTVDPFPKCLDRCVRPGLCNKCCQGMGYPRGQCSVLTCFCCNYRE